MPCTGPGNCTQTPCNGAGNCITDLAINFSYPNCRFRGPPSYRCSTNRRRGSTNRRRG